MTEKLTGKPTKVQKGKQIRHWGLQGQNNTQKTPHYLENKKLSLPTESNRTTILSSLTSHKTGEKEKQNKLREPLQGFLNVTKLVHKALRPTSQQRQRLG